MRVILKRSVLFFLIILMVVTMSSPAFAAGNEDVDTKACADLIERFADTVSRGDIEGYIPLFADDIRQEMLDYVDRWGTGDFFRESRLSVINIKKLSNDTGRLAASVSYDEEEKYPELAVYYAELDVAYKDERPEAGSKYQVFVTVKEDGAWKLYRVSVPNLIAIDRAGEGFGTSDEKAAVEEEKQRINLLRAPY